MGKINVIGLGPGNIDYLTGASIKKIKESNILIGGKRQLKDISPLLNENQTTFTLKKLEEMKHFVKEHTNKNIICFIVSGDTGYYSLLTYLKKNFPENEFEVVPGISSFQYLFSKIEKTWENFNLYSIHGRKLDIIKSLNDSINGIVLLTDTENNPYEIGKLLFENNLKTVKIIVGENLSYEDENIFFFYPDDFSNYKREYKMNVVVLEKEK